MYSRNLLIKEEQRLSAVHRRQRQYDSDAKVESEKRRLKRLAELEEKARRMGLEDGHKLSGSSTQRHRFVGKNDNPVHHGRTGHVQQTTTTESSKLCNDEQNRRRQVVLPNVGDVQIGGSVSVGSTSMATQQPTSNLTENTGHEPCQRVVHASMFGSHNIAAQPKHNDGHKLGGLDVDLQSARQRALDRLQMQYDAGKGRNE